MTIKNPGKIVTKISIVPEMVFRYLKKEIHIYKSILAKFYVTIYYIEMTIKNPGK